MAGVGRVVLPAVLGLAVALGAARGQNRPARFAEYRGDVTVGRGTAGEVGVGLQVPAGYYVRVGILAAAGVTWRDGAAPASGRVDVVARYLLDPFREAGWGLSLGGGVSVPYVDGDTRVRPYLSLVLDVEGPRVRGGPFSPAFQMGLGGGARFAFALRTSRGPWR